MSIVLTDSFDKYPTGGGTINGWVIGTNASIATTTPRTGTRHLETRQNEITKVLPAGYSEIIYGSGLRLNNIGTAGHLIRFAEIGAGVHHVRLEVDAIGRLVVKHAGSGATIGTGSIPLIPEAWYWVEVRILVHDTTGEVEVHLGGSTEINVAGVDTRNGGTGVIDQLSIISPFFNAGLLIDDVVVIDPSTGTPNDFIGDSRVECLFPNGNGNSSQFDGSDGNSTDNYLLVDEVPHDSDTTYVQSPDIGDKDTYAFGDVSLVAGTIHAVQKTAVVKKTSAGTRKIVQVSRLSATEVDTAEFDLPEAYVYTSAIEHTKPGGGAWAVADVNGAEFGIKVSS